MDKFKIRYTCHSIPEATSKLKGFELEGMYEGRMYNGLVEVSPHWGDGRPTRVISVAEFRKYFQFVEDLATAV